MPHRATPQPTPGHSGEPPRRKPRAKAPVGTPRRRALEELRAAEAAAFVDPSDVPERSYSGAQLDPVDGWPVFADGMSRRRWLEETADERKAAFVAELRANFGADTEGAA